MIKHSRGVGSFRVVRAYDACTLLPRYIKTKIRSDKAMSLSVSIAITFRKRKRNAPDFVEKERRTDYGKMKRFLYNSI